MNLLLAGKTRTRVQRRRRRDAGERGPGPIVYGLLLVVGVASIFPLYWSFVVASRDNSAIAAEVPPLAPGGNLISNIQNVFDTTDFWMALQNSLIVSTTVAGANVLLSSIAGFAFAKLRFRGRNSLFLVVIGTAMMPAQIGVIPLYLLVSDLGWYGRLEAVILPALISAFGVFWMRQACEESIPDELVDAARVDGCSTVRVFVHVALPAIPAGGSARHADLHGGLERLLLAAGHPRPQREPDRSGRVVPAGQRLLH